MHTASSSGGTDIGTEGFLIWDESVRLVKYLLIHTLKQGLLDELVCETRRKVPSVFAMIDPTLWLISADKAYCHLSGLSDMQWTKMEKPQSVAVISQKMDVLGPSSFYPRGAEHKRDW